jgi:hypothetical protein
LTAIAWEALCQALAFLRLEELPRVLPKLLEHLTKYRETTRPTALEKIRARFKAPVG